MVTIYKDIYAKNKPFYVPIDSIIDRIKSDKDANKIHRLRLETDKAERSRIKCSLPSICFSGKFKTRTDSGLLEHSGLVILDFDHVENIEEFKKEVCKDEFTYLAFISPSGDGLKVLVKIPPNKDTHETHYMALIEKYPQLDTTSKNISRVCYTSHDPDIYVNNDAKVFDKLPKVKEKPKQVELEVQTTDYAKLNIVAEMVRCSTDGSKHHDLIRASRLAGGFISGGLVEEHEIVRVLEHEVNLKSPDNFKLACKTIQDGIVYGKREPIYKQTANEHIARIKKEDIIIEGEIAKDVIFLSDIAEQIEYEYDNGITSGETTYYPDIDDHFRWMRGELNLMHGIMNHGKSTLMLQLCLIKSIKEGTKWGIFSPEQDPPRYFYKDLIHSYIGKSTEKHHKNRMSRLELKRGMDFINEHFYYIYPKNDSPTPDYINMRFRELIIKNNIDGCIIDPYNQLDNDIRRTNGREDLYLSTFLTSEKRFALEHDVYKIIITHPRGSLKKNVEGNYECPDVYDLAGGAMWGNKCDNILATYRPYYTTDKQNCETQFISQKIKKQKLNGIPGSAILGFDRFENRYKQMNGFTPFDRVIEEQTILTPNNDFQFNQGEAPF